MTKATSAKGDWLSRGWDDSDESFHKLAELRSRLSQFTKESSELDEVEIGGDRPIIVKRTETNDMVIEISAAYKSALDSRTEIHKGGTSLDEGTFEHLKTLFEESESPAVTTEEVAEFLGCSTSEATQRLIELEHKDKVDHSQSGKTTLWWPVEDIQEQKSDDENDLPEYLQKGVEKSKQDIREWVRRHQKEDESMEDAYERIRGKPSLEDIREVVSTSDFDAESFREAINKKEKSVNESKKDLRNVFE
jgi:hypothetical protein